MIKRAEILNKYFWSLYSLLGFDYHAFILCSSKDSDWVKNKLLQPLEEEHHLKCCIHYRDFDAGEVFLESMAESVHNSFKIIAVYSKNFQGSNYCKYELQLAEYRQVTQGDNCLVIIRIDETEFNMLPQRLQGRTVIDYSTRLERPFMMRRLLQFLQVPEDSDNQDAVTGQERNTNNRRDSCTRWTWRRIKNTFVRFDSTSSNGSMDFDDHDADTGQDRNANNRKDSPTGRGMKNTFMRLDSITSNGTAVSFV